MREKDALHLVREKEPFPGWTPNYIAHKAKCPSCQEDVWIVHFNIDPVRTKGR